MTIIKEGWNDPSFADIEIAKETMSKLDAAAADAKVDTLANVIAEVRRVSYAAGFQAGMAQTPPAQSTEGDP